jgi:hypothetical protein
MTHQPLPSIEIVSRADRHEASFNRRIVSVEGFEFSVQPDPDRFAAELLRMFRHLRELKLQHRAARKVGAP